MKKIIILISLFVLFYIIWRNNISNYKNFNVNFNVKPFKNIFYTRNCLELYKKLRYPNQSLIIRPPPRKPPNNMMNDFTMNGKMPITSYWYFNDVYSDSNSDNKSVINEVITTKFTKYLEKVRKNESLNYQDLVLNQMMHSYSSFIKDKLVAVVGTGQPWIEAIAYDIGASFITTLDYTRKKYELSNLKWVHINDYLDEHIENKKFQYFDVIASFSSIEHSGLGRYGDPLSPNGDVDAVKQVHCMLKPGGLFFLGLPTSLDGSNQLEFNAHRIYGKERLDLLFQGWELLDRKRDTSKYHEIFILKKI